MGLTILSMDPSYLEQQAKSVMIKEKRERERERYGLKKFIFLPCFSFLKLLPYFSHFPYRLLILPHTGTTQPLPSQGRIQEFW